MLGFILDPLHESRVHAKGFYMSRKVGRPHESIPIFSLGQPSMAFFLMLVFAEIQNFQNTFTAQFADFSEFLCSNSKSLCLYFSLLLHRVLLSVYTAV